VGVCDDGAGARGSDDEGAGGAGGGGDDRTGSLRGEERCGWAGGGIDEARCVKRSRRLDCKYRNQARRIVCAVA
jgi:hypothetical protein